MKPKYDANGYGRFLRSYDGGTIFDSEVCYKGEIIENLKAEDKELAEEFLSFSKEECLWEEGVAEGTANMGEILLLSTWYAVAHLGKKVEDFTLFTDYLRKTLKEKYKEIRDGGNNNFTMFNAKDYLFCAVELLYSDLDKILKEKCV